MKDWTGNMNSVFKCIGSSNHCEEEREENDYYATNPITIDKLLSVEEISHKVWECSAGENHLANRLKELGFEVITSDIIERRSKIDYIVDFLEIDKKDACDFDILTNPPYKFAKEFVLKALDILKEGRKVFMFLKLTFLEGKARYKEIFSKTPPKKIYVFSDRIACAKNGDFENLQSKTGAVAYAWFVWEKGYNGDTIIKWI